MFYAIVQITNTLPYSTEPKGKARLKRWRMKAVSFGVGFLQRDFRKVGKWINKPLFQYDCSNNFEK
jgi:hypothetical protein